MGQIKIGLKELTRFLVKAKKETLSGNGREIVPERSGFKEFEFIEGDWEYRTSSSDYLKMGGRGFGNEIVRFQGQPIWNMAYRGGMYYSFDTDLSFTMETFGFLKRALLQVPEDAPYRGPLDRLIDPVDGVNCGWSELGWFYTNEVSKFSDVVEFNGEESVYNYSKDCYVFSQEYIGGLVSSVRSLNDRDREQRNEEIYENLWGV